MSSFTFRSIWISDVHLGTRNLQSKQLLDFLVHTESEHLYLVGDILDLLQARRKWHWPPINDQIIHAVFEKARKGTKVFYIPGNHDHLLRAFDGNTLNNITIINRVIHETADGRRYLVLHGDKFDCVIQNSPWLATLGSMVYESLLVLNRVVNGVRTGLGFEYRSLSAWLKQQVKSVVNYIGSFEEVIVREVEENQVDGLICGHIHQAAVKTIGQVLYTNSGDWVESCTAIAETFEGNFELIKWTEPATAPVRERKSRRRARV